MSELYNKDISKHYAAYRPPIHSKILKQALDEVGALHFEQGVDIGCGTGISSEALSEFCVDVVGVEPSVEMLAQAFQAKNITYIQGSGDSIPLREQSSDVVTFAGSLSYAKSEQLVTELTRVCKPNAVVLAYDFKVCLLEFMRCLDVSIEAKTSNYDHQANFSGYQQLLELKVHQDELVLTMSSEQLAHVLFSSLRYYRALVEKFGQKSAFDTVVAKLGKDTEQKVRVEIYYSIYRINPSV